MYSFFREKRVDEVPGLVALTEDAFDLAAAYVPELEQFKGLIVNTRQACHRMMTLEEFVMSDGPCHILHVLNGLGEARGRLGARLPINWDASPEEWRLRDV